MKKTKAYAILLLVLGILVGCSSDPSSPDTGNEDPIDTFSDIQSQIFNANCTTCHGGTSPRGNLDLTAGNSYGNIVNVNSAQKAEFKIIEPNNAVDSYLIMKVSGDNRISGSKMPVGGSLSQQQIDALKAWVNKGAPND